MTGPAADHRMWVLVGPDYAGKSSALAALRARCPGWRFVAADDAELPGAAFAARVRAELQAEVLPRLGSTYSSDLLLSLLHAGVVHVRDVALRHLATAPVLVDSYSYKMLAKCRLRGLTDERLFAWWRTFPPPDGVILLDVDPDVAWERSGRGARLNLLEHYPDRPLPAGFLDFQRDLRVALLDEVRHLDVTVVDGGAEEQETLRRLTEILEAVP